MRWRRALMAGVLLLVPLAGCVGSPVSGSSWRTEADKAIGEAVSGLGTAQIVLESRPRGRLPHSYAVVILTEAVSAAEKGIGTFVVKQPPDRLHAENREVVEELQRASALLVEVRTRYSSPGPGDRGTRELLDEVKSELERLDALSKDVEATR